MFISALGLANSVRKPSFTVVTRVSVVAVADYLPPNSSIAASNSILTRFE
jgi:hypothetical protein